MISRRRFLGRSSLALLLMPSLTAACRSPRRWPAEWEPHEGCLMTWPHRQRLWEGKLEAAQREYAAVARAVARYEPVHLACVANERARARRLCGDRVTVHSLPMDDSWVRDNGPIYVVEDGARVAVDFRFNAWGGQFERYAADDALPTAWAKLRKERCETVDWVLEGGAIIGDGEGTLITTEECLTNPNRNGDTTKAEVEVRLKRHLGVAKVIWLPYGLSKDDLTSGHVDGVCCYIEPGRVLAQTTGAGAPADVRKRTTANLAALRAAVDAKGRKLQVEQLPHLAYPRVGGEPGLHTYINLYQANGGVVVPLAGVKETDAAAMAALKRIFGSRTVVGVPTPVIGWGGGGIHCITQQVPRQPR